MKTHNQKEDFIMPNTIYNVGYTCNRIGISIGEGTNVSKYSVQASNIISIAIIHNYDNATYPIVRVRMYTDMEVVENITEDPDHIFVTISLYGNIYKIDQETDVHTIVKPVNSLTISGNGYIENKNIPVSKMDQYKLGIKDTTDLNVDSKVPFEMYIYAGELVHKMRRKVQSIYRNTTVGTVCEDILKDVCHINIDPIQNQKRYDQILIPNLTALEAFSFFDRYYGLYPNGGSLYFDTDETAYLSNTAVNNGTDPIPVYVRTEKEDSSNASGVFLHGDRYLHQTQALNASVLSESDIERVMNPEIISDINVHDLSVHFKELDKLFDVSSIDQVKTQRIEQKNILHKTERTTLSIQEAARLNEKITRIDLSGAGFDLSQFKPNSRLNLIFESPIRGLKIAEAYRMKYACHVLTNSSGDIFLPQTTMQLCSN